jgi:segregation and condensation protein A
MSQPTNINFEQLLHWWSERNEEKNQDKVGVFWALLLLSSQSKVELNQSEFYQDLHINVKRINN